jgi:hypothetical protein
MLFYIATGLGVIFGPLPGLCMVWFSPEYVFWYNLLFSVPSFLFGIFYMAYWTKAPWGMYALRARQVSYWAHLFAFKDKLFSSAIPWIPTGAVGSNKRYKQFVIVSLFWYALTTIGILAGVCYNAKGLFDYNFYPIVFFTLFNLWVYLPCVWGDSGQ